MHVLLWGAHMRTPVSCFSTLRERRISDEDRGITSVEPETSFCLSFSPRTGLCQNKTHVILGAPRGCSLHGRGTRELPKANGRLALIGSWVGGKEKKKAVVDG